MIHWRRTIFFSIIVITNHFIINLAEDSMIEFYSYLPLDIELNNSYLVSFMLFPDELVHGTRENCI